MTLLHWLRARWAYPSSTHPGRTACLCLLLLVAPSLNAETSPKPPSGAATPSSAPAQSLPSSLPLRRDGGPGLGNDGPSALRAFGLVLLLMALAYWALKQVQKARRGTSNAGQGPWRKWIASNGAEGMRLVQSTRLTPKSSVHLLHWDGQEWMVGVTEQGITLLGQRRLDSQAAEGSASGEAP